VRRVTNTATYRKCSECTNGSIVFTDGREPAKVECPTCGGTAELLESRVIEIIEEMDIT
jgi:ribosomal protein S27E